MAHEFRVDVRSDMKRVIAEFNVLQDTVVNKATYRALNRALDAAATATSREMRREYNVRHRAILAAMKKRRASKNSHFARLMIEGARIGLIEFDARHSRRQAGASVKVKVQGARKIVTGAFIATRRWQSWQDKGEQSHRGVFRRVGKERYPIRYLRSVSIPQAFANKAVVEAVDRLAREAFVKNYEQQLRFLSAG
jgi:hypothetical protein